MYFFNFVLDIFYLNSKTILTLTFLKQNCIHKKTLKVHKWDRSYAASSTTSNCSTDGLYVQFPSAAAICKVTFPLIIQSYSIAFEGHLATDYASPVLEKVWKDSLDGMSTIKIF